MTSWSGQLASGGRGHGPRTVVFKASAALITLQSKLVIHQSAPHVAGQTAPGKGIASASTTSGMGGAHACHLAVTSERRGPATSLA